MPLDGRDTVEDRNDIGQQFPLLNPITRMAERLATLEAKSEGLEKDTQRIRESTHSIFNEMQKFVAMEQQCVTALTAINSAIKQHQERMDELHSGVNSLLLKGAQTSAIWWTITRVCIGLTAVGAVIGGVVAFIGWLLEHHAELVVH